MSQRTLGEEPISRLFTSPPLALLSAPPLSWKRYAIVEDPEQQPRSQRSRALRSPLAGQARTGSETFVRRGQGGRCCLSVCLSLRIHTHALWCTAPVKTSREIINWPITSSFSRNSRISLAVSRPAFGGKLLSCSDAQEYDCRMDNGVALGHILPSSYLERNHLGRLFFSRHFPS